MSNALFPSSRLDDWHTDRFRPDFYRTRIDVLARKLYDTMLSFKHIYVFQDMISDSITDAVDHSAYLPHLEVLPAQQG